MEEALHDVPLLREFAGLDNWKKTLPGLSIVLNQGFNVSAQARAVAKKAAPRWRRLQR